MFWPMVWLRTRSILLLRLPHRYSKWVIGKVSTKKSLSLELDQRLVKEKIVKSFVYDAETTSLVLTLGDKYDRFTITSPVDIDNWEHTVEGLQKTLAQRGINENHIRMICDTVDNDAIKISDFISPKNEKQPEKHMAFKYSNGGKDDLYEAIILAGKPTFLKYNSKTGKLVAIPRLQEGVRIIVPPRQENYPAYTPYEFESLEEVQKYLESARGDTLDSLYSEALKITSTYNDQSLEERRLLAFEIITSYFQDKFPTVHYDVVTGANGSGKSVWGLTFVSLGYRPAFLTDVTAANIFRILGCVEVGQCTMVFDEADKIYERPELMSILKSGYSPTERVSRINDYSRQPEYFMPFGFKIILAESIPNVRETKGVRDRSFEWTAYKGSPKFDIKEDLEAQGNPGRQQRLELLRNFRNRMLFHRLLHYKDPLPDIDVGFGGREKELVKPYIQVFYGSQAQKDVESTLEHFLRQRNERKDTGLEAALYPITLRLIKDRGLEIFYRDVWNDIINGTIPGKYDEHKPDEYKTEDYGTICRNQLGGILEHTFGGKRQHRRGGNTFTFDQAKLERVGESFNLKNRIQTRLVSGNGHGEDVKAVKALGIGHEDGNGNNGEVSRGKNGLNEEEKQTKLPITPSQPSRLHTTPDFESVQKELKRIND
jgi:hypothetical protein